MDRRHFLSMLGLGAVGLTLPGVAQADILKQAAANPNIKPISGSWFEFQHPGGKEGVYWDKDLRQFTAAQWREKIREISETGMEYLVMMNVAAHGKAFFDTKLAPKFEMGCEDPIETVLSAADEFGVKSHKYLCRLRNAVFAQCAHADKLCIEQLQLLVQTISHCSHVPFCKP